MEMVCTLILVASNFALEAQQTDTVVILSLRLALVMVRKLLVAKSHSLLVSPLLKPRVVVESPLLLVRVRTQTCWMVVMEEMLFLPEEWHMVPTCKIVVVQSTLLVDVR